MKYTQIVLTDPIGLHARPAALFVETASRFQSEIRVRNQTKSGDWVNAKSILAVLTCGVEQNNLIGIEANGSDEIEAIEALENLVSQNFIAE